MIVIRSDNTSSLQELAEAATPGPWVTAEWDGTTVITARWADETTDPDERGPFACIGAASERDAAFIAAANPTAVLALLDEVERLRLEVEATRAANRLLTATVARVEALVDRFYARNQGWMSNAWDDIADGIRAALDGTQ